MDRRKKDLQDLIDSCKRGKRQAQFELYQRYAPAMLNTCFRIVNNREDAEDVLQEGFINVFRKIGQYRNDAAFGAWVKRIMVNQSINFLRKRRLMTQPLEESDAHQEIDETPDEVIYEFSVDQVIDNMQRLAPGYRTVLSLYLLEGYDHQEIADILGISRSASLTQYHRGKKRLQSLLKKTIEHESLRKVL
ncbi:MAG: sigma-70 family RNA polymerase sigma factor [Bacteroidota bacterium]